MANDTPSSILKRIIFISVVLGIMFGLGLVLILRAIFKPDLSLIAVVLPMFIIAILMVRSLIRLRRTIVSLRQACVGIKFLRSVAPRGLPPG